MSFTPIRILTQHSRALVGGLLTALLLSACASAPVAPTESLNNARGAIENAEQAEARQYAPAELEEAQAQLTAAERAVSEERMLEAERLAEQARVSAALAKARTEEAKAAAINRQMERSAEALREEMRRGGDQQ
ncbi:DUF4398 domain-containing protein [Marinimicrobium sp. C2-29]|uniref:DUF4398 domain-containing protein n=1 Tax=Marinimicrobium sp. C2-29 TaxID=3139825 RepID=UPI00313957FE